VKQELQTFFSMQPELVLDASPLRSQTKQQCIWLELIYYEALPKLEDEGRVYDAE
jgi:hypothetical protein